MILSNGIIRPGVIREVLTNGHIKVSSPGLFSITDDLELLPTIMPWFIGSNSNTFSQPIVGEEVWILNFSDNPLQLFWFKKEYTGEKWENIENIDSAQNVEIICNRDATNGWATIYFSDGTGWVIGNGNAKIELLSDGSIKMGIGKSNRCVHINNNNISIGSENSSAHPAAYGDKVEDVFNALCNLLNGVATKALANPYTAAIGSEIVSKISKITNKISDISSEHITID